MKIIGHRGAASLALENTLESIRAAKKAGVDAIEFDVRMTKDGHFVLAHDSSLERVSSFADTIHLLHLDELVPDVKLNNGEPLPTLQQALRVAGETPILLEVKGDDWAKHLSHVLGELKPKNVTVIAINGDELDLFHLLMPNIPTYLIQQFNPIDTFQALRTAQASGFTGVDFNFWLLNPFTYWLARRYNLEIVVYTVNNVWMARFLAFLFPTIGITTDCPQDMQFLRKKRR